MSAPATDGRRGPRVRTDRARAVNAHVAQRIRLRRVEIGMTQERLAELCSITFQQIQKYERGWNRVSAGTLDALSMALEVPVAWFFDEMGAPALREAALVVERDRLTLELMRAFHALDDDQLRRHALNIVSEIASMAGLARARRRVA